MNKETLSLNYILNSGFRLVLGLVALYLCYRYYTYLLKKDNPRQFNIKRFDTKNIKFIILGFISIFILQIFLNMAISSLGLNSTSANQNVLIEALKNRNFLYGFFIVIFGPIIEELIFRGLFFDLFFKHASKMKNILGVISNGMLFYFIHMGFTVHVSGIIYFVMGMIFATTYIKTKDIRCGMGIHILNNLISYLGMIAK
ncbi:CPBP family intramembrane glutamic endopeptidase [Holzapfeliella floricola]|nr:type II CAAX endopeptidase family protein [Holzapfeliella floricola]